MSEKGQKFQRNVTVRRRQKGKKVTTLNHVKRQADHDLQVGWRVSIFWFVASAHKMAAEEAKQFLPSPFSLG